MPVTVKPSPHGANGVHSYFATDAKDILLRASPATKASHLELLQSSFGSDELTLDIHPRNNGFVHACIAAYSDHHHLIIRPEDVWFAILVQLSAYINKNAEELRGKFVAHEGKKELEVHYEVGDRYSVNYEDFAMQMSKLLESNVVDPDLRHWIMPCFSTTTDTDNVVASILMMASMQSYFSYEMSIACGLASVTLLGKQSDWALLEDKLEKMATFGEEPAQFASLLKPIILRFTRSFDDPAAPETVDFWQRIFSKGPNGSGMDYFSGWITAFCFWNEKGKRMYWPRDGGLTFDGVVYGMIDHKNVPPGWAKVPVTVDDNGDVFQAQMFAGSAGYSCSSSGHPVRGGAVALDTIRPETGWWMFQDSSKDPNGDSENGYGYD